MKGDAYDRLTALLDKLPSKDRRALEEAVFAVVRYEVTKAEREGERRGRREAAATILEARRRP